MAMSPHRRCVRTDQSQTGPRLNNPIRLHVIGAATSSNLIAEGVNSNVFHHFLTDKAGAAYHFTANWRARDRSVARTRS